MKKLIEHSHCKLNMVCIVFFLFIGAIAPSILLAQGYPACWPSETPTNCSSNLGYAPDPFVPEHTPIKYIKVVLHVFHKEDPANLGQYMVHPTNPDNFTADHKDYLKSWFTHPDGINGLLGGGLCDDPTDDSPWMKDARIRLVLEHGVEGQDIFFHPDNSGWGTGYYNCHPNGASYDYSEFVKGKYVTGVGGWAPFLPPSYIAQMSIPENRNAFHVFIARGTWIDLNQDGTPDDDVYNNPSDCFSF